MKFLTDDPVAQAVTYQRVMFDARALRYGCATAGRVTAESQDHISVYEVTAALAG